MNEFCVTVRTADLLNVLQQVAKDGHDYVQLMVLDEDVVDGDRIPAQLHIEASSDPDFHDFSSTNDYGEIDIV